MERFRKTPADYAEPKMWELVIKVRSRWRPRPRNLGTTPVGWAVQGAPAVWGGKRGGESGGKLSYPILRGGPRWLLVCWGILKDQLPKAGMIKP